MGQLTSASSASALGGPLLQMISTLEAENAELYSSAAALGLVAQRQCLDVSERVFAADGLLRDAPQEWFALIMRIVNELREENVALHVALMSVPTSSQPSVASMSVPTSSRPSVISVPDRSESALEWLESPESVDELRQLLALRAINDPEPADDGGILDDFDGTDEELLELVQALMDENDELHTKLGGRAKAPQIATRLSERSIRSKASSARSRSSRSSDLAELEALWDEAVYREQMEDLLDEIGEVKGKLQMQKARDEHNKIRSARQAGGKLGDILPSLGGNGGFGRLEPASTPTRARLGEFVPSLRRDIPVGLEAPREPIAYEPVARELVGRVAFATRGQPVAA